MSQLWGVFQHLDIDHYKVKVRDEAVMNHMAPNVESVVAEIHWCVQEQLEMTELKQEMAMMGSSHIPTLFS